MSLSVRSRMTLWYAGGFALTALALVVDLGFLQLEVQMKPDPLGVGEDDAPLVQLRAIVVELVVALHERPDVVAIAAGVVGEERERIDARGREVVERADHPFATSVAPRRVTVAPVAHMWLPGLERP